MTIMRATSRHVPSFEERSATRRTSSVRCRPSRFLFALVSRLLQSSMLWIYLHLSLSLTKFCLLLGLSN